MLRVHPGALMIGGALALSCAASRDPLGAASPAATGDDPRRPPGVAIDPLSRLPPAVSSAPVESGIAVLAEPVDPRPAMETVAAFFAAVVRESSDDLERVLEGAAHARSSPKARADPALPWWRRRFERLDYTAVAADVLYRPSEVEVHSALAANALVAARGRGLPTVPKGDELLVRVPIVAPRAAQLFGSEVVLLVRRSAAGHGYKIAQLFEDFRIP